MTATATVPDDSKPYAESTARSGQDAAPPAADPIRSSVYAAYWQERSGFFTGESELPQRPSTR
jgi:hypothetical protein